MKQFSFYALLFGAILFIASCDKDVENTSLKVDLATTSTVKGYVYADLDRTTAGLEYAPAGTNLILSVNYNDLNGAVSAGKWKDTVKVGNNGEFSAKVPVDDNSVSLNIDPQPFEYDQTYFNGVSVAAKQKKIFEATTKIVTLSTSVNEIIQVSYSFVGLANAVQMTTITITVVAELNAVKAGMEPVIGQKLLLSADGFAIETPATDANGKISVSVPVGTLISGAVKIGSYPKIVSALSTVNTTYSYDGVVGIFSATATEATINMGNGTAL